MYIHAPCFNLDELARDNLHIHTSFSRCAKPEMTVENIFAEAARISLVGWLSTSSAYFWRALRHLPMSMYRAAMMNT